MLVSFIVSCATERFQTVLWYSLAYSSLLRPIIQLKGKRIECCKQRRDESLRSPNLLVTVFKVEMEKPLKRLLELPALAHVLEGAGGHGLRD